MSIIGWTIRSVIALSGLSLLIVGGSAIVESINSTDYSRAFDKRKWFRNIKQSFIFLVFVTLVVGIGTGAVNLWIYAGRV